MSGRARRHGSGGRAPRGVALRAAGLLAALCAAAAAVAGGCSFGLDDVEPPGTGGQGGAGTSSSSGGGGDASTTAPTTTGPTTSSGGGGAGGDAGAGGAGGGGPPPVSGCADGTREAYLNDAAYPNIAACAGGFTVAGVTTTASLSPACNREAGDDGPNPSGAGCSVEDLCAADFHVCRTKDEVAAKGAACPPETTPPAFWLTRQVMNESTAPDIVCVDSPGGDDNNLVGCGQGVGGPPDGNDGCEPLVVIMKTGDCTNAPPWSCPDGAHEAAVVTKPGLGNGGVLCCRNP